MKTRLIMTIAINCMIILGMVLNNLIFNDKDDDLAVIVIGFVFGISISVFLDQFKKFINQD